MHHDSAITGIAQMIQLAVAPVFLLSGIAAMLAVMTNRLARIVDRARTLEVEHIGATPVLRAWIARELAPLSRRARLIGFAITLCTITALLVCAVIATLFLGAFLEFDPYVPVAVTFIAAMLAFFGGLLAFLREVLVATARLRIGPREVPAAPSD
jgi:MFS family permease